MSTSITLSANTLMLAPPALLLAGGLIVAVALRGFLTTGIEVARLNAANDAKTARWLFLRGYRKTPHAGPDLTDEPEVLALSDRSHADEQADHTDTDRPHWWVTVVAFVVLAPVAFARRQLPVLVAWVRERLKSDEQLAAEFMTPAEVEYAGRRRSDEASVNDAYRSRHTHPDFQTGVFPQINAAIPAQRTGEVEA